MISLNKENKSSGKWVVLIGSFLLMLTHTLTLQTLPPLLMGISKEMMISHAQAGLIMGIFTIPGIVLSVLIPYISKYSNEKTIIIIALTIMIVGLCSFSFSRTFPLLLVSRTIIGIGATAIPVLTPALVVAAFADDNLGRPMGVLKTGVPLGTIIALNMAGGLVQKFNWRLIILGVAIILGAILIFTLYILPAQRIESANEADETDIKNILSLFRMRAKLWMLALIWAFVNGQLTAYITFAPQYFQSVGIALQKGTLIASLVMLPAALLSLPLGIVMDKVGVGKQMLLGGIAIIAIAFLLIGKTGLPFYFITIAMGIGLSPIALVVYSVLPKLVEPHQVGAGYGVITIALNTGASIGPTAFGKLLDITGGDFTVSFNVLALLSVCAVIAFIGPIQSIFRN